MNLIEFSHDLLAAWNAHDLDVIMDHYSDDFEITSPVIKSVLGIEDGTISGKENVRIWWRRVLDKVPDLKFTFHDTALTADGSMLLMYKSSHNGKTVASAFHFNDKGQIKREIFYS
jgi:ketosteroid isomerase-like protein